MITVDTTINISVCYAIMHLEPCIVSERVSVIDSRSAPTQSSASSLIIAVSVLGILILFCGACSNYYRSWKTHKESPHNREPQE